MEQHIRTGTSFQKKTVVVTFDGAYADILYTAKEVLDTCQIPATVFSASSNMMERGKFWWDTLEDFCIANSFQGQLEVEINDQIFRWPLITRQDKFKAYGHLFSILLDSPPSEQRDILGQITQNMDLQADELDMHRTMDAQEVKQLAAGDLITLGGYTHSGARLSSLTEAQQIEEVSKNKCILEEVLGHNIEYFAYPFGNETNSVCSINATDVLQDNGIALACGNAYGMLRLSDKTNCYDLPRVKVGNWNLYTFYSFLERLFG